MPWNLLVMKAEVALKGFHIDCWDEGFNGRKKKKLNSISPQTLLHYFRYI